MKLKSIYQGQLYEGRFMPDISAFYSRKWQGYNMVCHAHQRHEIMYVNEGRALLYIQKSVKDYSDTAEINEGTTDFEVIEFKKGDLVFLDSDVWHRLHIHEADTCHVYNIEFSFTPCQSSSMSTMRDLFAASTDFQKLCCSRKQSVMIKDTDTSIAATIKLLVKELSAFHNRNTDPFLKNHLLILLITYIARTAASRLEDRQSLAYLKQADDFIRRHFASQIKITQIAQAVKLSPAYLQRLFKKYNGMTLTEYITSLRIEHAKVLIENTDMPVIDIAAQVGYNSRQSLYHAFSQTTQMSLHEFRRSSAYKNTHLESGHNFKEADDAQHSL